MGRRRDRSLVLAAQRGDTRAREEVARTCLPLVYNVVGRSLRSSGATEDVVQETMLRVVRGLPELRKPESLRAWTLAIAVRQIAAHQAQSEDNPVVLEDRPQIDDFENLTILRLQLSGQRRQVAQAAGWLDADHRIVLSLWWQESSGQISRVELAQALDSSVPYAAVRVQRMRGQLDRARAVVAALQTRPRCPDLEQVLEAWDGQASPLWRKRIDRHVRDCSFCVGANADVVPVEQLLTGLGLVALPVALAGSMFGKAGTVANLKTAQAGYHSSGRPSVVRRLVHGAQANPLMSAAAVTAVVVGSVGAITLSSRPAEPQARPVAEIAVSQIPSPVATPAVPTPTKVKVTVAVTKKAAKPSDAPSTSTSVKAKVAVPEPACDDGSTGAAWADWPMPNPAGSGLPHLARYTVRDGVVHDEVTCLEWQREAAEDEYVWEDAKTYCDELGLDGGGWHLPTRVELTSIVDTTRDNPAINPGAFPATTPRFFWTSTPWAVASDPSRSWIINFYEGLASNNAFQNTEQHVRCVRGDAGTGDPDYEVTPEEVTDPGTGLVWQRRRSPELSAGNAQKYCEKLNLGGHPWRLPSIQELATTVDETQVSPAIDRKAFPGTAPDAYYWSATRPSPKPSARWALDYEDGFITYRDAETGFARCVRS